MKVQLYKNIRNELFKTREFFFKLNNRFPYFSGFLELGYHFLYTLKFIITGKILELKTRGEYGKLDFNKVCHVNPQKIKYYQGKEFNK